MATKPKTDTKKSESASTKTEATKTEAAKTETTKTETKASEASASSKESGTETSGDAGSGGGGGGKSDTSSRPISYFSSVSTDDYRSGWDDVFGNGGKKPKRTPAKRPAKRVSKLPMTITLDAEDLEPGVRDQLEAIFRKQAKKERLNYDKLSGNGQVSLQVSCRISNA
jgi:hypothetical protein